MPNNDLTGSDVATNAPDGCFILSYGQNYLGFYPTNKTVSANKAYLIAPPSLSAKSLRFVIDDETTEINSVDSASHKVIYRLDGTRLDKEQKGVNIVNGIKIVK